MIAKGVYGVSPYKMIAKGVSPVLDIRYIIYCIFLYVYIRFKEAKVERNLLKIFVTHFFFL